MQVIGTLRLEYEYDFLNLVRMLSIIMSHTNLVPRASFTYWSTTGRRDGSGDLTGLKFESCTRTQSLTRSPVVRSEVR